MSLQYTLVNDYSANLSTNASKWLPDFGLGLNNNYYVREMFTKSSSTQFLHDSKTLILAINCLKVAKPNVD